MFLISCQKVKKVNREVLLISFSSPGHIFSTFFMKKVDECLNDWKSGKAQGIVDRKHIE